MCKWSDAELLKVLFVSSFRLPTKGVVSTIAKSGISLLERRRADRVVCLVIRMFERSLPELYVPPYDGEDEDEDGFDSLLAVLARDPSEQHIKQDAMQEFEMAEEDWQDTSYVPQKSESSYAFVNPKHGHMTDFDSAYSVQDQTRFMKRDLGQVQGTTMSRAKKVRVSYEGPSTDPVFMQYYVKAATKKFVVEDKNGAPIYLCPFPGCSSKHKSEGSLRTHMENHARGGTRYFECSSCLAGFYSSGCLKSHKITHIRQTGEHLCEVETCGKRYSTAEGLRLHTRNHHQINKNWKCMAEGCDRCFVRQADLRMHLIRMHCDERPYPCEHKGCRKAFACHSELRRHMEISHKVKIKGGQKSRPPTKKIQHLLHKARVYLKEKRKKLRERKSRGK